LKQSLVRPHTQKNLLRRVLRLKLSGRILFLLRLKNFSLAPSVTRLTSELLVPQFWYDIICVISVNSQVKHVTRKHEALPEYFKQVSATDQADQPPITKFTTAVLPEKALLKKAVLAITLNHLPFNALSECNFREAFMRSVELSPKQAKELTIKLAQELDARVTAKFSGMNFFLLVIC
jgi:hypothetical protein